MKPEIKAWLPEYSFVPAKYVTGDGDQPVMLKTDFEAWRDKLIEGAQVVSALSEDGVWENRSCSDDTYTALLICPREIKKQTPLEIAVEAIKFIAENGGRSSADYARDALSKIEAAK